MKGTVSLGTCAWPGKVAHVQQLAPGHHHTTVRNTDTIRTGTWNVRTRYQCGKLANMKQGMARMNINILKMCEMRWDNKGQVDFQSNECRIIHSRKHMKAGFGSFSTRKKLIAMEVPRNLHRNGRS